MKLSLHPLVLLAGGFSFLFLALFVLVLVMALAPTPPAGRLGIRGLKRSRSLRGQSFWSECEPFVRWVAGRLSPLLSNNARAKLDRHIVLAGDLLGVIPEEYVALCACLAGLFALLGSIICVAFHLAPVWAALAALVGGTIPWLQFSGEIQKRSQRIQNHLPHVVDLISLSLSAGLDFPGALRQVLEKSSDLSDPMMEETGFVLQELLIGKTRRQALQEFNVRCPYEAVTEFVGSVVQAEERGNPLADVLNVQATSSRARRSVRAEDIAAKAGLKILIPCLFVFVSVILLIMAPLFMQLGPALEGL